MNITSRQIGRVAVVSISGSMDALTATDATSFLREQIGAGHSQLVVDLSQVDFMSSAGLRAILTALKESRRQGGDLRLAGAQAGVDKVLKMSGFTSILKAFDTVDAAAASFE